MLDFAVRLSEQFDSSLTWSETPKLKPRRQISRMGPVNQNQYNLFWGAGGTGGLDPPPPPPPPPEKAQTCRVSLQYWSGSSTSSARQQNAISMAFRWGADDGPIMSVTKLSRFVALTKLSRSAHGACFLIILKNQRTCRATKCV